MKILNSILILFSLLFISCKDVETIGSVKKVGSNTEHQSFVESENDKLFLVSKNTIRELNNQFVSNLNFQNLKFDSLEIEKIATSSKLNVFSTSKGLLLANAIQNKNLKKIEVKSFSICDRIAILDSLVLVHSGNNDCQPDKNGELNIFKPDKTLKTNLLKSQSLENVVDWKEMNGLLWILYKNGAIEVYKNNGNRDLEKIANFQLEPGFHTIKSSPKLNKILIFGKDGLVQLKLDSNNKIVLINEI